MSRSVLAIVVSAALSATLVVTYAALGTNLRAIPAHDPCASQEWRSSGGVEAALEQIVLATADGAACELGVPREELVLALGSGSDLDAFAAKHGVTRDRAESAIRKGLDRAISDAEAADAIGDRTARLLRRLSALFPLGVLLSVLDDASSLLS